MAADGTLDASFNPEMNGPVNTMVLQADGQILVGGDFSSINGTERKKFARMDATGTLDPSLKIEFDGSVFSILTRANDKLLLGGNFTLVDQIQRQLLVQMRNSPVIQSITATSPTDVQWLRGGSAPEVFNATFELSTDGGINYAPMNGSAIRVGHTANWQITTSGLPVSGHIRARGRHYGGLGNSNSGLIQQVSAFNLGLAPIVSHASPAGSSTVGGRQVTLSGKYLTGATAVSFGGTPASSFSVISDTQITAITPAHAAGVVSIDVTTTNGSNATNGLYTYSLPDIAVAQAGPLVDGSSQVLFSAARASSSVPLTFSITNPNYADLTDLAVSLSGADDADFIVSPLTVTSLPLGSNGATFTVTFTPQIGVNKTANLHISSNATGDKNPFDITLSGNVRNTRQAPQVIAFTPPAKVSLGEAPLILAALASSGLPVSYTVISGPATIEGNVLNITDKGAVKIQAEQAGNADFSPAVPVVRTITAAATPASLTLTNLTQVYTGTPRPVTAFGASGSVEVKYKVQGQYGPEAPTKVGSYAVHVLTSAGITKTATLIITKAPLFVQPFDQRKFIGQANPPLTFAYSGFLGEDHAGNAISKAPKVVTKASSSSTGGLYSITASGGSSANYRFIYLPGTMKVESFAGGYETLLTDSESSRPVAKLSLTVSSSSKTFSAKLNTPDETSALGFAGKLNTNILTETTTGTASLKKGDATYLIHFTLPISGNFSAEAQRNTAIIGTTTTGRRLLRLTKTQSLTYAGAHSALWNPAKPAGDDVPAGAGWAVTTVDSKGVLKFIGKLADGTRFTSSLAADIGTDPGYRMFIQPYLPARRGSYLTGAFALKEHSDLPTRRYVAFEDEADFVWSKATRTQDSAYRAGFGPVETRFTLDPWLPPVSAKGLTPAITLPQRLGLSSPANTFTARYSLFESLSFEDLPKTLFLNASTNVVAVISPVTTPANVTKWKISLTPKNGAFVGSFELNDEGDKRTVSFSGLMRQPPSGESSPLIGNGHFLLPALTPAPDDEIISGEISFQR